MLSRSVFRIGLALLALIAFSTALPRGAGATIYYVGDVLPDFDSDGVHWDQDIDDNLDGVGPFPGSDDDGDGVPDAYDASPLDPSVPTLIADMGLSTGSPYTIGLGDDLTLALSISTLSLTNSGMLVFDFAQDDVADGWAQAGVSPFNETITNARLTAFGINGPGTHQFDMAAYGVGVVGAPLSGVDLTTVVTQTVTFTVIPEPSTALLLAGGLAGLAAARGRRSLHIRRPYAARGSALPMTGSTSGTGMQTRA